MLATVTAEVNYQCYSLFFETHIYDYLPIQIF